MSSFINNCTSGMPFWGEADRDRSGHYTSTSPQQSASIITGSELHWTVEPRREISAPPGCVSNTDWWSDTTSLDPSFSVFGEGAWSVGQKVHHGPLFAAPNGMATAAPVLGQDFPAVQRALSDFRSCTPPLLDWTQVLGPWHLTSSWDCPVDTASHHSGHVGSTNSLGMGPEIPAFQPAPECRRMPTDRLPSTAALNSAQRSTYCDPVPDTSSAPRPCGQRWDLSSNATTFRCLWASGGQTRCTALITGERRSVTSHLRNEHNFTCDGQTVACAWGECTASMQRRNIPRHIVACHFEIKVKCSQCGLALSRADANKKHRLACTGGRIPAAVDPAEEDDGQVEF